MDLINFVVTLLKGFEMKNKKDDEKRRLRYTAGYLPICRVQQIIVL